MRLILFLISVLITAASSGQQIAVMKKGSVNARYTLGDEIRFELKDQPRQTFRAAIIAIREFDFITVQKDTIAFARVSKLRFENKSRRKYGLSSIVAGAALVGLSFALEEPFGDSNPQSVKGLRYAGILGGGMGVFIMLTSKSSMKINGIRRLKYIGYDSPLYR